MNYSEIHNWLMRSLPATAAQLLAELEKLHRYLPKSYVGFPKTESELVEVLKTLRDRGMVAQCSEHKPEDLQAVWRYKSGEVVKREPQLTMF